MAKLSFQIHCNGPAHNGETPFERAFTDLYINEQLLVRNNRNRGFTYTLDVECYKNCDPKDMVLVKVMD